MIKPIKINLFISFIKYDRTCFVVFLRQIIWFPPVFRRLHKIVSCESAIIYARYKENHVKILFIFRLVCCRIDRTKTEMLRTVARIANPWNHFVYFIHLNNSDRVVTGHSHFELPTRSEF